MNAIVFDSTKPRQTNRRFGRGVLPSEPQREPYSAEDLAWAAEALNAGSDCYVVTGWGTSDMDDREMEALYADSFAGWDATRRGTGVSMDLEEECARFGVRTPEVLAQHAAEWARYQSRKAQVSYRLA